MAKKKKTGSVHTAVRRSRSPRGGRTSTTVSSGTKRAVPRSTTPTRSTPSLPKTPALIAPKPGSMAEEFGTIGRFASRAEQRRAEALLSEKTPERRQELLSRHSLTLSEKKKMTGSPSDRHNFPRNMVKPLSMKDGDFHLWGPFWSSVGNAFRIEYYEHDSKQPGTKWSSSFYCQREEDAIRLGEAARKITNRAGWIALRDEAMEIAKKSDGFIYRVMLQERETFQKHGA